MLSNIADCNSSPTSKDITNNNNINNDLLMINKMITDSELQNPLSNLNRSSLLERMKDETDKAEKDDKHKIQFDGVSENKFTNGFSITDILNFTTRLQLNKI